MRISKNIVAIYDAINLKLDRSEIGGEKNEYAIKNYRAT